MAGSDNHRGDAWARMYRVVHGWPLLAGVPVPLFLLIMLAGVVGIFGASMVGGLTAAGVVVLATVAAWAGIAWLFRQDQVAVPLFFLRGRVRLGPVISSYNPSWTVIELREDGGNG